MYREKKKFKQLHTGGKHLLEILEERYGGDETKTTGEKHPITPRMDDGDETEEERPRSARAACKTINI